VSSRDTSLKRPTTVGLVVKPGKNVCSVVGLDEGGTVVLRRRARWDNLIALVGKLPACIVAMEACCGAHHLGRLFAAHGHDVRLMSPEYVRPYVKPWLHCPYCERRVAKLFRALAGYFCRSCVGNPIYANQTKSAKGRRHFEACKLHQRLGGIVSIAAPFPERP
jgi:hypothetical protein